MNLLRQYPELALFLCIAGGYLLGKVRVKTVELGGICGTLIVALFLGAQGVQINDQVKTVAFAVFIYALGYLGGPQFFAHLNKSGLRYGVLPLIEVVFVVSFAAVLASVFDLDVGTASGILAGSATESAVLGTATEAIGKLGLPPELTEQYQGNVATAYTVCYLFGLVTIVLFTSQLAPKLLGIDLEQASRELWEKTSKGERKLEDGEQEPLPALVGRTYLVRDPAGRTVAEVEADLAEEVSIEAVYRTGRTLRLSPALRLRRKDLVLVVGSREGAIQAGKKIGPETSGIPGLDVPLVIRQVVLTNKNTDGRSIDAIRRSVPGFESNGVYVTDLRRGETELPPVPQTQVHRGDVVTLVGTRARLDRVTGKLGVLVKNDGTDYIYLGLGLAAGVLIGAITVRLGGIPLSLGTGGGCLISGLVFGWIRSRKPTFGAFPPAAATTIRDLGLAVFIAVTGLSAGPHAWALLKEYGVLLPFAAICIVLVPALLGLWVGHKFLKIEGPLLVGAIAGKQCSTPAISAVTAVAKSTVPLLGYTITYTISNFLLPLTGPVLVGIVGK